MEGEKKERPQNRNLKPLGSGMLTPEEEYEIRRKSAETTNKKRKRNADIRAAVRAIANLNINGKAKSKDVEKLVSVEDLGESGAPLISQLVYTQFQCALNGDKEARDWICKMLGVDETVAEAVKGAVQGLAAADPFSGENGGGVRIHLIRGEKPREDESEEDAATRAANRLAVVEAMRAIGEAAGDAVANSLNNAPTEDVTPDDA